MSWQKVKVLTSLGKMHQRTRPLSPSPWGAFHLSCLPPRDSGRIVRRKHNPPAKWAKAGDAGKKRSQLGWSFSDPLLKVKLRVVGLSRKLPLKQLKTQNARGWLEATKSKCHRFHGSNHPTLHTFLSIASLVKGIFIIGSLGVFSKPKTTMGNFEFSGHYIICFCGFNGHPMGNCSHLVVTYHLFSGFPKWSLSHPMSIMFIRPFDQPPYAFPRSSSRG